VESFIYFGVIGLLALKPEVFAALITAAAAIVFIIRIRGLGRTGRDEEKFVEGPRPPATLGIASLVAPIFGFSVGFMIMALTPQTSGIWFAGGEWMIVSMAIASIVGWVLASRSLRKRERWPHIAVVGLLVNRVALACTLPLLMAVVMMGQS